jgi:hypothetical protein
MYVKTASGWEQIATTIQAIPQGLVPIVPTSVTNGATTGDGEITFAAQTSISLNGVFSATYDSYLLLFDVSTAAGNTAVSFRLRAAGTDNSTASSYLIALTGVNTSGTAVQLGSTSSSATFTYLPSGYAYGFGEFIFTDPFSASVTKVSARTLGTDSGYASQVGRSGTLAHNQATSYDGVTFITSAAITGSMRVYGYSKGSLTQPQTIQPYSQAAGNVAASATNGSTSSPLFWDAGVTVTFPAGRFSVAPVVTAAARLATAVVWSSIDSVTSTGFTVRAVRVGSYPGSGTSHHWQATQMTSSSSAG